MSLSPVAVVGLGYVGLPLALAFGRVTRTFGLDLDGEKVAAYRSRIDPTGEIPGARFAEATELEFFTDPEVIGRADFVIIAVPTPIDAARRPDFSLLDAATRLVGSRLRRGATVVFESTVFPGATEERSIPLLEHASGLRAREHFSVGYSPERINPGDGEHTLARVVKVVSGDTPETCRRVAELYRAIVPAGVYEASSIRVAEAAKVIENTQRDLNIALVNELALIFHRLGLDTAEVLEAASTKWNFLPFRPGLVGGHCIGVDPYYLTHKAEQVGYHPEVILAGRRINDSMASYVASKTVKCIIGSGRAVKGAKVCVLGVTYKENCSDVRNSKVAEVVRELEEFGCLVSVHDPRAANRDAEREYGIRLFRWDELPSEVDALVLAVPHADYLELPVDRLLGRLAPGGVVIDVKSALPPDEVRARGYALWRL